MPAEEANVDCTDMADEICVACSQADVWGHTDVILVAQFRRSRIDPKRELTRRLCGAKLPLPGAKPEKIEANVCTSRNFQKKKLKFISYYFT